MSYHVPHWDWSGTTFEPPDAVADFLIEAGVKPRGGDNSVLICAGPQWSMVPYKERDNDAAGSVENYEKAAKRCEKEEEWPVMDRGRIEKLFRQLPKAALFEPEPLRFTTLAAVTGEIPLLGGGHC